MNTAQKTQAINIELSFFNKNNNNRKLSVSDTIKILLKITALLIMICFCEKSHEINLAKAILLNFWFIDLYEREEKTTRKMHLAIKVTGSINVPQFMKTKNTMEIVSTKFKAMIWKTNILCLTINLRIKRYRKSPY